MFACVCVFVFKVFVLYIRVGNAISMLGLTAITFWHN